MFFDIDTATDDHQVKWPDCIDVPRRRIDGHCNTITCRDRLAVQRDQFPLEVLSTNVMIGEAQGFYGRRHRHQREIIEKKETESGRV